MALFVPGFEDGHVYHHAQVFAEIHRYQNEIGHKTDAVTVHGLDLGDREALLNVYGHKINEKLTRNAPLGTLVFNDVEHMNVSLIVFNFMEII